MAELHWFPAIVADWLGSTAISMMLPEQEGAYWRLLNLAWAKGDTEPSLPADDAVLAQMSRLGSRWKKLGPLVRAQFIERDGRLYNEKLVAVWQDQQRAHAAAVAKASAGGRALADKRRATSSAPSTAPSTPQERLEPANSEFRIQNSKEVAEEEFTPIRISVWVNSAITERWGEQPCPLTHGAATELHAAIVAACIDPSVARESIYRQCRSLRQAKPPRTVNYFLQGIEDDWHKEIARRALAASGEVPPSPIAPRSGKSTSNAGEASYAAGRSAFEAA